jgi:hypothetical protein
MRFLSTSSSLQFFFAALVSISTLTSTFAAPVKWDDSALERRNNPVNVAGHTIQKGQQLSPGTHTKSTVWQVASTNGHANPGHVIKQYHGGRTVGDHEVAGLQAAGQYVAHNNDHIVMKHVQGKTLAQIAGGIQDHKQRSEYVNGMKPHVAAKAAEYAQHRGVLHTDLNMNNVVVHPTTGHVDLVDWEHHVTPTNDPHRQFTTNPNHIHSTLNTVWDSVQTPPDYKKTSSGRRK